MADTTYQILRCLDSGDLYIGKAHSECACPYCRIAELETKLERITAEDKRFYKGLAGRPMTPDDASFCTDHVKRMREILLEAMGE